MKGFFSPLVAVVVLSILFLTLMLSFSSQTANLTTSSLLQAKKVSERAIDIKKLVSFTVVDAYLDAFALSCSSGDFCENYKTKLNDYLNQLAAAINDEITLSFSTSVSCGTSVGVEVNVTLNSQFASADRSFSYTLPAFNRDGLNVWGKYEIACPTPTPTPTPPP